MIAKNSLALALNLLADEGTQETHKSMMDYSVKALSTFQENEQRLVYGIVLRPDRVDLQSDVMSAKEIEDSAHFFLAFGDQMNIQHIGKVAARPVESFIAPVDFEYENGAKVKKGDWVLVSKIFDDGLWERIKSGEVNEYSPGGPSILKVKEVI